MPFADPVARRAYVRKYYLANKAKAVAAARAWKARNPDRTRQINADWRTSNRPRMAVLSKRWYHANLDHARKLAREKEAKRRATVQGKAVKACRDRVHKALKRFSATKAAKTIELLGCTIPEFIDHIARQFKARMTWQNHGTVWEIDHIIPVVKFDLTDAAQQRACFHHTNCRPLLCFDNRSKGGR
jgi:hypothetical protein